MIHLTIFIDFISEFACQSVHSVYFWPQRLKATAQVCPNHAKSFGHLFHNLQILPWKNLPFSAILWLLEENSTLSIPFNFAGHFLRMFGLLHVCNNYMWLHGIYCPKCHLIMCKYHHSNFNFFFQIHTYIAFIHTKKDNVDVNYF